MITIVRGDCRLVLKGMAAEHVHCVVTSPPYWGLRDYGVAGQLGLEVDIGDYVEGMVGVFREVRRVLRRDGTVWLNMGDSYARDFKQLIGVPWRVAFALQADGWYLRQDIIWSKPNPMPESVTDRCTKAHEYIFLLSKSERYYYDQEAIAEPSISDHPSGNGYKRDARLSYQNADGSARGNDQQWSGIGGKRNKRSVWEVATTPFSEAHFATFPPALIEPCILAGCPVGGTVLDPFGGAGTTGLVADRLGRNAVLIELKPEYVEMAELRIRNDAPLFAEVKSVPEYNASDDMQRSLEDCYAAVRERKAAAGAGWPQE